jgi:ATP-dependent DNA helicase PIF1
MEGLNEGQLEAYQAIQDGKSIFLTGPGGTGKSYLLNLVYTRLPKQTGRSISLTALTGCAAILLHPKAKTIHSWAGIGLGSEPVATLYANVKKSHKSYKRWITTDVLVIDEISMMTPELFEKLDELGRKLRRNESVPFGGLQIVLVGDFYQLPPVVRESSQTRFVFESPLWKKMDLFTKELTQIVRQKDSVFQTVLNEARRGELTKGSMKILKKRIGLDYKSLTIQPTMLFLRRAQVDTINMTHLKKLTTEFHTFKASTQFEAIQMISEQSRKDPHLQAAITKFDGMAPYTPELILAVGAQVMLMTNLKSEAGLVNGSRGVVIGFGLPPSLDEKEKKDPLIQAQVDKKLLLPVVRFMNGKEEMIKMHVWDVPETVGIKRAQIPLKLAYAITIHKSQGSTLDCALIDVGGQTFEYGQAYVALSRVKDLESLYIHDLDPGAFRAHPRVKEFYDSLHSQVN